MRTVSPHLCHSWLLGLWLVLSLLPAATGIVASDDVVAPNVEFIAEVQAGRVTTADASWWGFNPADATSALQAAFDSPARKVVVPDMGRPWVVTRSSCPATKRSSLDRV